jgi:hypothetical protein
MSSVSLKAAAPSFSSRSCGLSPSGITRIRLPGWGRVGWGDLAAEFMGIRERISHAERNKAIRHV